MSKTETKNETETFLEKAEGVNISTRTKFDYLKIHSRIILDDRNISITQRVPALRRLVESSKEYEGIHFSNDDLRNTLWTVRRERAGGVLAIPAKAKLNRVSEPYLLEGIIMDGTSNIIVAKPKIGKSRLISQVIGHLAKGRGEFLGKKLKALNDRKVLFVGTDQPESDWATCFHLAGLLPDGKMHDCILELYDSSHPLHLDDEGIEKITNSCKENKGLIIVMDAYYKCVQPLGLQEKDASYADPLIDLLEAIGPYKPTLILIHHSGKARADDSASSASRGSNQLPGSVSHTISLDRLPKESPLAPRDKRIRMITEGRASESVELLIEQVDNGYNWISHGDAEEVALKLKASEVISNLNDRQTDALDWICSQNEPITIRQLVSELKLPGKNPEARGRQVVLALQRHHLIERAEDQAPMGDMGGTPARTYKATQMAKDAIDF